MARPKIRGAKNDLSKVSAVDWARLAAFIDGEGHIALNENKMSNGKHYAYLRVIITNTDPRLIVWLQRTFGGGVLSQDRTKYGERRCWKWTATCRHAEMILKGCLNHFIMKKDQAEIGLAFQETVRFHRWNPTPASVSELRAEYRSRLLAAREPKDCDIVRDEHGNAVEVTVN